MGRPLEEYYKNIRFNLSQKMDDANKAEYALLNAKMKQFQKLIGNVKTTPFQANVFKQLRSFTDSPDFLKS